MSAFDGYTFSPEDFSGTVRLFPVPNLVLFPHVMQPLHLFEPRYCDLLRDALADDHLIAMATLAPGWESDYEGRPPLGPVACLSRIAVSRPLDDGTYNLLLVGMRRVALVEELPPRKSYREARAEVLDDAYPADEASRRRVLKDDLHRALTRILPGLPQAREQLEQLLRGDVPLGVLTDVIAYALELGMEPREALLAETNVHRRAELLLEHLGEAATGIPSPGSEPVVFPPSFSAN